MSILEDVRQATMEGKIDQTSSLVKYALEQGISTEVIINEGLIAAMSIIGEKFKNDEVFVPEMLVAAMAMENGIKEMEPYFVAEERKYLAKMVIGTVKNDVHDIGKNLASIILRGNGVEVVDLGVDVSEDDFLNAVKEHKPQYLGLSSLLTTTMPAMGSTIEALQKAGLRENVKVLVGGAPVSQKFADEIKADGYCDNATEAVEIIKKEQKAE